MTYKLTEGAIERILKGELCEKPTLQVITSKKISSQGSDRYRLFLSDGRQSYPSAAPEKPEITTNAASKHIIQTEEASHQPLPRPTPSVYSKPNVPAAAAATTGSGGGSYSIKSSTPTMPTGGRVHSIASLTPYQNRWRIRAHVTQKSNIRTWSNSRGEGKLFSVNLVDESGEIKATGFTDAVDKFFNLLEVNKVFYIRRATLKTANKLYSNVKNDYEMTFNNDTCIEPCEDDVDLPSMTFSFVKINELEKTQPNGLVDVIGTLKQCGDLSTVIGKQSRREIPKREIQLVDQSGMVVALTLWGKDAESFDGSGNPVLAIKGARVSDWGGRSLSVLASSQLIINPDIQEAHLLRGWYDREGSNMDFTGFKSEMGSGVSGGGTNWKFFRQVQSENLGQGDKADYFTSTGTVIFLRKENCMYQLFYGELSLGNRNQGRPHKRYKDNLKTNIKWADLQPRQLELAASDRRHWRALTRKACSAIVVDRRQRLAATRERLHRNVSQVPTTIGVPCPTCNRMCVSEFGLRSHMRVHR